MIGVRRREPEYDIWAGEVRQCEAARGNRLHLWCMAVRPEDLVGEEWAEWYRLSPAERFAESMKLWDTYLAMGGSLEPEPDTQSPFFDREEWRENSSDGRAGLRILRRG